MRRQEKRKRKKIERCGKTEAAYGKTQDLDYTRTVERSP
ncbi:unnamed protein product [Tenebrio molitor]|nr:unnamed protein product [Tenebrio molitor]